MITGGPVVAIIQARMSSSRLPGKVLRPLGDQPVLARVLARVRRAQLLDQVVLATTNDPSDDPIVAFCAEQACPCFRGELYDVLDRYYQAALHFGAETVVRITADCPMIDPQEIERVVEAFFASGADFASNRLPPPYRRTTPIGMDVEVCSLSALQRAWQEATEKFEREHVMPYLYDTPGRFTVHIAERNPALGHLRFTIDTPADLVLAEAVFAHFGQRDDFSLQELLEANEKHPEWQATVSNVVHKNLFEVDRRASAKTDESEKAND